MIKKGIISNTKSEIQVIIAMFMLTRSSERIFNTSNCTGNIILHVESNDTKQ